MRWLIYLLIFLAGFAAGAWRAGAPGHGVVRSAVPLPIVILVLAALGTFTIMVARGENEMSDLAAISVVTLGVAFAVLAFAGGLFGAWFRRAGQRSQ